jgi:hypothetical protein
MIALPYGRSRGAVSISIMPAVSNLVTASAERRRQHLTYYWTKLYQQTDFWLANLGWNIIICQRLNAGLPRLDSTRLTRTTLY